MSDLEMAGIQLFTNIEGAPIDSPGHFALYETAAKAGCPIWLHPQMHEWYDWLAEYEIHRTFGWPFDTTVAMARLVYSGVFERFPALSVLTHHLGGMLPYYIGRLRTFFEARVDNPGMYPDFGAPAFTGPIEDQFQSVYGDAVIGGAKPTLACGRSFIRGGRDRVRDGLPFGPDEGRTFMQQAVEVVRSVGDAGTRDAIFGGTIASLCDC